MHAGLVLMFVCVCVYECLVVVVFFLFRFYCCYLCNNLAIASTVRVHALEFLNNFSKHRGMFKVHARWNRFGFHLFRWTFFFLLHLLHSSLLFHITIGAHRIDGKSMGNGQDTQKKHINYNNNTTEKLDSVFLVRWMSIKFASKNCTHLLYI